MGERSAEQEAGCWLRVSDCKQRAVYVHGRKVAYRYPTGKEPRSGQVNKMGKTHCSSNERGRVRPSE